MAGDEVDVAFSLLPSVTRERIDRAFDSVVRPSIPSFCDSPRKRRNLRHDQGASDDSAMAGGFIPNDQPGGFIVDDEPGGFIVDDPTPGGLVVDDEQSGHAADDDVDEEDPSSARIDQIPLALIPDALQSLDLQPDDEDILSVFRNAASGWSAPGKPVSTREIDDEQYVNRRDWRAVCAALLDTGDVVDEEEERSTGRDVDMDAPDSGEDSGSEHEYQDESTDLSELSDSGDEYHEGGFISEKARGKQKAANVPSPRSSRRKPATSSDSDDQTQKSRPVTARQKAECRRTFSLFFPEVDEEKLDSQRIMIKDISRVASLLNEKIKAEEIVEMLEAFSSSRDKSMGLADFERMMIMAKLA